NLGRYEAPVVARAIQWYDTLWEDAEPYDLSAVFEEALRLRTPWEIFMRVLWQLYGDEIEEDAAIDEGLPLTSFQKHGVARALRLIRETGGAIVADEVGLGKTFIAGEVLQVYREGRQRALLICPASLRDTTWRRFLARFELFVECLSFEELASDHQLRDEQRPKASQEKLQRPLDEYQLVVVDEAHNYRNPDAPTRAAMLRRRLFGRRRDVLLLTATPVNNSLWDLYHLMRFFVRQDAHFADRGILSVRRRFEAAMREDPANLSPDLLYPIIDATTVKRTRQFVKKHYPGDTITGSDGNPVQIVFPQPRALSVHYDLDAVLPGFFDRLESSLDPDSDETISFVRYWPDAYRREAGDRDEAHRARALIGLLRSQLLKRFESSAFAFGKTARKMICEHDAFLDALDAGYVVSTDFMRELSADGEGIFEELLASTAHKTSTELYDVEGLRSAITRDRDRLQTLADEVARVSPDRDPKLAALAEALVEIAEQARHDATDNADETQKRKVLVFSFFEDTVKWIRGFLAR
ncbi:MAG: SNF2-related protein, partial [Rhodococcus sp.]|nr:SNF2-related protein [Rhodococcus sp. (in: high G+C Gram-positive bacteria)]